MPLPSSIAFQQVADVIDKLALGDPKHIRSIHIDSEAVTLIRFRVNETGHHYLSGIGEIATETIVIPIDHSAPAPLATERPVLGGFVDDDVTGGR